MIVDFAQVVTGRQEQAPRLLIYSPPKIGKTGFAAGIPDVLFLAAEQGTQEYDVARVPVIPACHGRGPLHAPCGWKQALAWIDLLLTKPHPYKALAVDTLDWLESVLFTHLIATDSRARTTIVEAHGGYGKAFKIAVEHWRMLAARLDVLSLRGLPIVLLAHSSVEHFKDPVTQEIDQHRLKLQKEGAAFWTEWVDGILFANFEMLHNTGDDTWTNTGKRVLYTSPPTNFAHVAGNRYGLPPQIDLSYPALASALALSTPAALAAELETVLATLPNTFPYNGEPKTADDIRRGFKGAIDRRSMRLLIDVARQIAQQQPQPVSKNPQ